MKLIQPPIKRGEQSAAVGNLQDTLLALLKMGLISDNQSVIADLTKRLLEERTAQVFKDGTAKAVTIFQDWMRLIITGEVDVPTAEALNKLLITFFGTLEAEQKESRRIVNGKVVREGKPVAGILVRAFHVSDKTVIGLGEATTDNEGSYTLRYETLPGEVAINLRIAVFDAGGKTLSESAVRQNADALEVVNIAVPLFTTPAATNQVEGVVITEDSLPAEKLKLRLYQRDFGGAAKQVAETVTRESGLYAFTYNSDGKAANLEVRAVDANGGETPLSYARYGVEDKVSLNLIAPAQLQPLASEFQRLSNDVSAKIGSVQTLANAKENVAQRDLTMLHQATGWDARVLALAATATQVTRATGVGLEAAYGLLRAGLPSDPQKLARVSNEAVSQALNTASKAGVIGLSQQQIADVQTQFGTFRREVRLKDKAPGATSAYGDLLKNSGLAVEAQTKFADLYVNHRGSTAELWQKAEASGISNADVKKLQLQGKLGYLTHNNADLTAVLQTEIGNTDQLSRLVDQGLYDKATWKARLQTQAGNDARKLQQLIPPLYSGATTEERLDAYTDDLARKVRLSFPTQVIGQMVRKGELPLNNIAPEVKATVQTFLGNAAPLGFKFGQTTVDRFIAQNSGVLNGIAPEHLEATKQTVKTLQSAYQLSPSNDAMQVLLRLGLTSAYDITAIPFDTWIGHYGYYFPSQEQARLVYRKSEQVSSVLYNFYTIAKQTEATPTLYGLAGTPEQHVAAKADLKAGLKDFPTMESLFGSLDYCECEHCRSVLSPAAYLVDLLQFLDLEDPVWENFLADWKNKHAGERYEKDWNYDHAGEKYEDQRKKPYHALIERRPDLPHLQLTCENTNTALPYIDIVNEILEYYVANDHLAAEAVHDTGEATTAELLAEPQNVLPAAYDALLGARYPLTLPFDLWLETVRQFCGYFETPLPQLLETFRPTDELFANDKAYDRAAVFAEYLGLSPEEYALFTDPAPLTAWHDLYGYENANQATTPAVDQEGQRLDLNSAKALSRRLGVSYKELVELVKTNFVNPKLNALATLHKLGIGAGDVFFYKQHANLLTEDESKFSDAGRRRLNEVKGFKQRLASAAQAFGVTVNEAEQWIEVPWLAGDFKAILVLADPNAGCDFDQTILRYADGSAADNMAFLRLNLFVRLWRKLGWTIEETDRALQTFIPKNTPFDNDHLDDTPLKTALIYLAHLKRLDELLKLGKQGRIKLLTLWDKLPTAGKQSLYAQVFLTRNVLKADPVFDDPQGLYLTKPNVFVKDHLLALRAALGLTTDEVEHILKDAGLMLEDAPLTLDTVSLLYRYMLLAKALQLPVDELIALTQLSERKPFHPINTDPLTKLDDDHLYTETLRFVEDARLLKTIGVKIEDLDYLLRHRFDPVGKYRSNPDALLTLMRTLHTGIRNIKAEQAIPSDPSAVTDDLLRQKMSLILPADVVETFFAMWVGTIEYQVTAGGIAAGDALKPSDFEQTPAIRRVSYNATKSEQTLVFRGVLSDEQETALRNEFNSPVLGDLLNAVQARAETFFQQHLQQQSLNTVTNTGFLLPADFPELFTPLPPIDESKPEAEKKDLRKQQEDTLRTRRAKLVNAFFPFLQQRLMRQFVTQTVTVALGGETVLTEALLTDAVLLSDQAGKPLLSAFAAADARGVSATFFAADGTGASENILLTTADTALKPVATAAQSARFEGYLEVPETGAYRFFAMLDKIDASVELRFDHLPNPVLRGTGVNAPDEISEFIELKAGIPYRFTFEARALNGGNVRLLAQSESLPKGSLARLTLYPQMMVDRVQNALTLLSKAILWTQILGLNEREVRHLLTHAGDFDDLSLSKLPTRTGSNSPAQAAALCRQFLRVANYVHLKQAMVNSSDDLIGIFEQARRTHPATDDPDRIDDYEADLLKELHKRLAELTRREVEAVKGAAEQLGFAATHISTASALQVTAPDFVDERGLQRLWEALQLIERIGVPATAIASWTKIVNRPATPEQREERRIIAQEVRRMVKARFEPETWLRVAQPIHDKLRQRQRDALVAHVMHKHGFKRMEQLFEYFLIDPGMEPVVQTSRIQLAIASLQVFIQRSLLNLERNVHPSAINARHWAWMKRYRVWEANRKIFLFPENWLEPEWRDDKTFMFGELESALLQGDVNDDLVEDAFLNYLKKLEELARLNIVGMHLEDNPLTPASNTLHVIGRTYSEPHKYFYRRYAHNMWTPWEPVTAEIQGDHIVPVFWRNRLCVFWVTFLEKSESQAPAGAEGTTKLVDINYSQLHGAVQAAVKKRVQAQLHWSEYLQGQWSTRTSGPLSADFESPVATTFKNSDVFVSVSKEVVEDGTEGAVKIHLSGSGLTFTFRLATRNSPLEKAVGEAAPQFPYPNSSKQANHYNGSGAWQVKFEPTITTINGVLQLSDTPAKPILQNGNAYSVLPCDNTIALGSPEIASLVSPVFYQDNLRTFYVEPSLEDDTIETWEEWVITTPEPKGEFEPPRWWEELPIKALIPDRLRIPKPLGPDDFLPGPIDELSRIKDFATNPDWVTNPGTVVKFGPDYIGSTGWQEFAEIPINNVRPDAGVVVNVTVGSEVQPGQALVLNQSRERAGVTGAFLSANQVHVVGNSGLNAGLVQTIKQQGFSGSNSLGAFKR